MHDTSPPTTMALRRRQLLRLPLAVPLAWALPPALGVAGLAGLRRPAMAQPAAPPSAERAAQTLGFYMGPGCNGTVRLNKQAAWLGRAAQWHADFLAQDSWTELVKAATRGAQCWQPTGLATTIGVPMLPRQAGVDLASGARGDYDTYFVQVAQALVRNGLGNAVLRIGWEFNHDWFAWRADRDPVAWTAFWRRIVAAMRGVPGAGFRFDWCPAWGTGKLAPERVYPGDDVVDMIGMDIYNTTWNPTTPEQRWIVKRDQPHGLVWHRTFAAQHGKPVSFPEWGTGLRPDGRGGGDDAYFIQQMAAWLAGSELAYHIYWDYKAPDFNARLSDGSKPAAEAAFLAAFGGAR
ncbi:MAG TPA: glycosyl hydrolase [Pseudorhodoferax sp.]|nr:glycosyl hydrolase [Pseudorhodoferax sp.]